MSKPSVYQEGDPGDSNPMIIDTGCQSKSQTLKTFYGRFKIKSFAELMTCCSAKESWLTCMTDSPRYTNMWENYAEDFSGICIEYDESDLYRCGFRFDWVQYKDGIPRDELDCSNTSKSIGTMLRTKSTSYSNEHELRHAHMGSAGGVNGEGKSKNCYFELPKPTYVYIGYKAEKNQELYGQLFSRIGDVSRTIVHPDETVQG